MTNDDCCIHQSDAVKCSLPFDAVFDVFDAVFTATTPLSLNELKEMSIKMVLFLRTIYITEVFITTWAKNPNPFSFSLTMKFAVWVVISVKCLNSFFMD